MSYVMAAPETMAATATDLAGIGSELGEARRAATPPTVALLPAASDEVSASVAQVFSRYAEDFHGLAAQAAAFHVQFVQNLRTSAFSYAKAANASPLAAIVAGAQKLAVFSPVEALAGVR